MKRKKHVEIMIGLENLKWAKVLRFSASLETTCLWPLVFAIQWIIIFFLV